MIVQHAVAQLLEAVSKLHGGRTPPVCGGMQEYSRDVSDHLLRVLRTIEGRREMLNTVMQVNLAMIALAENEVMRRLASYAALLPFRP